MLTDNGRALENSVLVSLPPDRAPDEAALKDLATRLRTAFPCGRRRIPGNHQTPPCQTRYPDGHGDCAV